MPKKAVEQLAGLRARKKGIHFVQIIREPLPESALAEAFSVE
jgi:hypothetical protein